MEIHVKKTTIFTIPNLLSMFRIVLAFLFLAVYRADGLEPKWVYLALILALSGISDFLDGKIARRFNMISELGKVLDPIADKLTQGILLLCLLHKYMIVKFALGLFLIKEAFMAIGGIMVIQHSGENNGAKWYGKINTAIFYAIMLVLILFQDIPSNVANILIGISTVCMAVTLILYLDCYRKILRQKKAPSKSKTD